MRTSQNCATSIPSNCSTDTIDQVTKHSLWFVTFLILKNSAFTPAQTGKKIIVVGNGMVGHKFIETLVNILKPLSSR